MININKIYQWSRTNLFSNWYNSIISLIIIYSFVALLHNFLIGYFLMLRLKEVQQTNVTETALVGYSLKFGSKDLFMVYILITKYGELI